MLTKINESNIMFSPCDKCYIISTKCAIHVTCTLLHKPCLVLRCFGWPKTLFETSIFYEHVSWWVWQKKLRSAQKPWSSSKSLLFEGRFTLAPPRKLYENYLFWDPQAQKVLLNQNPSKICVISLGEDAPCGLGRGSGESSEGDI